MKLPPLRYAELSRIHAQRQSSVVTTLLLEFPETVPPFCTDLLRHAPESFEDLRYGLVASVAYDLHLNHQHVSPLSVQTAIAKRPIKADLSEIWNFFKLNPVPLSGALLEFECEELWNAYTFRREATLFSEAAEALIAQPHQADSIVSNVRKTLDSLTHKNGDGLPEIIDGSKLLSLEPDLPQVLIEELLHKGSKMSLGGGSKTCKSWTFLDIGLAIATGTDWLGFRCAHGKVLIVNFEIAQSWMRYRLDKVCQVRNLHPEPGMIDFWNLRGYSAPHADLMPKIISRAKALGYALVIIDPSYKLIGDGDENSASDVGAMMSSFELVTVQTGAAIAFGAHFAKGCAADKEHIDRISGSGVFARDPDTIITLTPHEEPDCYTFEATLRNLPRLQPFVVRWQFPVFDRADDLNPDDLKKKTGRPKSFNADQVLALLDDKPLCTRDWQKLAHTELNVSRTVFYRLRQSLIDSKRILCSKIDNLWTPIHPK